MSSSDFGYIELRRKILEGELKPGEPLKERDLCEELGVSRTPIREALRRLVADGLAEMRPRRSIIVSEYSDLELREIFELGSILETHVAGLAAEKAEPEDVAVLKEQLSVMEDMLQNPPEDIPVQYARLDQEFHHQIAATARNGRIDQMLRQTVSLRLLANLMTDYEPANFENSVAHHRQIVQAIESGDAEAARKAMDEHVSASRSLRIANRPS